ncbi:DUF1266 domain-containing protein [Thiosocius teredinicola]|uniref:DUF1266 domain-containing protein n=1 Tax=Thiosocius teredinicola TaxID=1973002 RepID=UPI000990E75A
MTDTLDTIIKIIAGLTVGAVIFAGSRWWDIRRARAALKRADADELGWFSRIPHKHNRNLTRQLSVGAILSESNLFPVNVIDPCKPKAEMQDWLRGAWNVNGPSEAMMQIQALLDGTHVYLFDEILQQSTVMDEHQLREYLSGDHGPQGVAEINEFVDNFVNGQATFRNAGYLEANAAGELTTYGFDLGRAVTVTRVAVGAGYLSEEEARPLIEKAASICTQHFASWNEFARSFVLGRGIWGGVDDPNFNNMQEIANYWLTASASPWNVEGWLASGSSSPVAQRG